MFKLHQYMTFLSLVSIVAMVAVVGLLQPSAAPQEAVQTMPLEVQEDSQGNVIGQAGSHESIRWRGGGLCGQAQTACLTSGAPGSDVCNLADEICFE